MIVVRPALLGLLSLLAISFAPPAAAVTDCDTVMGCVDDAADALTAVCDSLECGASGLVREVVDLVDREVRWTVTYVAEAILDLLDHVCEIAGSCEG